MSYWLKKLGDLVRDQSEPWAAVERPWAIELRDLLSSLTLSSIGGAFPKCKCSVENKTMLFVYDLMRVTQQLVSYLCSLLRPLLGLYWVLEATAPSTILQELVEQQEPVTNNPSWTGSKSNSFA